MRSWSATVGIHPPPAYFQAYTLTGDALRSIAVPTALLTAQDDPIIPVSDYHELRANELTRVLVEPHGGHNGFLDGPRLRSRYETWLADMFDGYGAARP